MSNRYARILAAGGVAVLVAALGATALAATATTWTIQPGGTIQAISSRVTVVTDTKNHNHAFNCNSSTASGTLKSGSGLPGSHAGSLSAVSFSGCSSPGGPPAALLAGGLPWHVNFSSYKAVEGVVRGTISHIQIMASFAGHACTTVIDGTSAAAADGRVAFRYTDSTGQLTVLTTGGNLHFYDVSSGCLGAVNSGDPATLSLTDAVTPEQAITSP